MIREHPLAAACALAGLGCIALGTGVAASNAPAAAAASAFEAAPFLLFARVLAPVLGPRFGELANLGGCGCARGPLPGALSLPAIVLCALTFGPVPTIARLAVAVALVLRGRREAEHAHGHGTHPRPDDLFIDLERVAGSAFLASIASAILGAWATRIPEPLALVAGLGLGALAPCATAGIAIAAAFAHASPTIAYGVLGTAGLLTLPLGRRPSPLGSPPERRALLGAALLAGALGGLALRGPSGLVNPRLLVPIGLGAAIASAAIPRARSRSRASALVPMLMLGSLVAVPRAPDYRADATRLDDAFPGEHLTFTGVASTRPDGSSTLTRYAITCCRLDATPVSVRLDRRLAAALEGRWVVTTGTLVRAGTAGLDLHPQQFHAIAAPADPYMYR